MSPWIGSQFSVLGNRASPYFSVTSGASVTFGVSSSRVRTRSILTCRERISASSRARFWIGSKMPMA